jgi:5-methylcytosine-specific restriction enzyme subunit McrC
VKVVGVQLREWETLEPGRGSVLTGLTLDDCDTGRRLAERLTKAGRIEVLELARGLELRASSFVGRFSLGDLTVTIPPKLSGSPLLNLLRYAYGLRNLSLYEPVGYAATQFTFQDLLIQQLTAEARELLARGIHRDYEKRHSELAIPRGRIDFNRYARAGSRARVVLPCVEHPRVEDTLLNQVLLGGLGLAGQMTSDVDLRAQVNRLAKMLSASVAMCRLTGAMMAEVWDVMDRRTTAYKPALEIIGILLEGEGVSLEGDANRVRLPGFLFDMNRFFQALLLRFLRENLDGYEVEDECRFKGLFRYDPAKNPLRRQAPVQKPDYVVRRGRKIVAVLDAKYRDLWERPLPREMLYQLALYALGQTGPTRRTTILYPTMETVAREQRIVVQEPVGGVSQAEVVIRPVKLLELDELVRDRGPHAGKRKNAYAAQLAFSD